MLILCWRSLLIQHKELKKIQLCKVALQTTSVVPTKQNPAEGLREAGTVEFKKNFHRFISESRLLPANVSDKGSIDMED